MRLAVMQPYFFPYLGYFQLIHAVDVFVVYDDVNFIKGGWINRNNILMQGYAQRITMPLHKASPSCLINQVQVVERHEKLLKSIQQSYSKAPQFKGVFPAIEKIFSLQEDSLAKFLYSSLCIISNHLDLYPKWHLSSALKKDNSLRGQEKILAICEELGASHYINLPGGKDLYNRDDFSQKRIQLSFIEPKSVTYRQFNNDFVPNLSIIDTMMFNDKLQCSRLLQEYDLV